MSTRIGDSHLSPGNTKPDFKRVIPAIPDTKWRVGAVIDAEMLREYRNLKQAEACSTKCWYCGRHNCEGHY